MKANLVLDVILVTFALLAVLMACKKNTTNSVPANPPAKDASSASTRPEPAKTPAAPSAHVPLTPPPAPVTPPASQTAPGVAK